MRKIRIVLLFVLSAFLFSSCDEIEGIIAVLPEFSTDLPKVISGNYAYYENEDDVGYTTLYHFDPESGEFTRSSAYEEEKRGTFSYEYERFAITECNGYITFTYEDGTKETYGFLYVATALEGPKTLSLKQNGVETVYEYKGN